MKTLTFDRFDLGIDLRKGPSVSDANRLREMTNAEVTLGLAAQKRPGLVKVTTLAPGTRGLFAADGQWHTFYGHGTVIHADSRFKAHKVAHPGGERPIAEVHFAQQVNGRFYTAVSYADGTLKHHWLNGETPTAIMDANCPHSAAVIPAAEKLFTVHGDVVRYCATGRPRDWSSENDAGFLNVGWHFAGERTANALGRYRNRLLVLARDGVQVWQVDPDPKAMALVDRVDNIGTHYPHTLATVSGDLIFLSDAGFRSITTAPYTESLSDVDLGSPIDPLVRDAIAPLAAALNGSSALQAMSMPRAVYFAGGSQYLCALGDQVFVYSTSRTAKLSAWSQWRVPFPVDGFAEQNGVLYLRTGDDVYQLSGDAQTDDAVPFTVTLALPYLDLKAPAEMKRLIGAQVIAAGEYTFSVGFDERHPNARTAPMRFKGTTRGAIHIPLHCTGMAFAPRFENHDDGPFRLDAVTLQYETLRG